MKWHFTLYIFPARQNAPLRWVSNKGYYEVVETLIQAGANIHADHNYALKWALYNNHYNVAELLIETTRDKFNKDLNLLVFLRAKYGEEFMRKFNLNIQYKYLRKY